MQNSNLNTSKSINTGKVFKILNTKYIYSILSSNLNTCILNTDQHWRSMRLTWIPRLYDGTTYRRCISRDCWL